MNTDNLTEHEKKIYSSGFKFGYRSMLVIGAIAALIHIGPPTSWKYSEKRQAKEYTEKVEKAGEYVVPSKLEVLMEDLDGDGTIETIMKYDSTTYLLKLDSLGKPVIQEYKLKTSETEIIYK